MKSFTDRNFLKLLDYTPEEIQTLIDSAADLRQKRKPVFLTAFAKEKPLRYFLKRPVHVLAVHLK